MRESLRVALATLAAAAAFLFLFLGQRWHLAVSALIALLLYGALYLMLKPSLRIGKVRVDSLRGGEELHRLMADAHEDMRSIYEASQTIRDAGIREKAAGLHQLGNSILAYLNQNPQKIGSARRFFSYYLDTGASILTRYMKLAAANPSSPQVQRLTPETDRAVDTLRRAFMGQFNKLIQNELMDVEADIELLESTLRTEDEA